MGSGHVNGLHKNFGQGSHVGLVGFGKTFSFIISVVPGNIQGHLLTQGLIHGLQHVGIVVTGVLEALVLSPKTN